MNTTRPDILTAARAAYEAHRTYHPIPSCRPGGSRELPTWEDATEELRQSWINEVARQTEIAARVSQ